MAQLLRCYRQQDYPRERMELVVLDDGSDSVADLLDGAPQVRYEHTDAMTIGAKRNQLAMLARGDIIVHMDDDDYYPPTRVSDAVNALTHNTAEIAGSSALNLYFVQTGTLGRNGPFAREHATAGTMAYTRRYLDTHRFDDTLVRAEEASFTDGFQSPMVQLLPQRTILVIAHTQNTFDKTRVRLKPLPGKLKDLVSCKDSLRFYRYQLPRLLGLAVEPKN
jgi:glycosyltransferase involved in cell wall biosynthesis